MRADAARGSVSGGSSRIATASRSIVQATIGVFAYCASLCATAQPPQPAATIALERASCASSTCHGGVIDRGEHWSFAWTLWADRDPHAQAGLVLHNDLSNAIVFSLDPSIAQKRVDGDESWTVDRDNLLRRRCISCHASVTQSDCEVQNRPIDPLLLRQGVSCQSCHGDSEKWLHQHYAPDFAVSEASEPHVAQSEIVAQKKAVGMLDTESILGRASGCVRCHVGSRTADGLVRDMNHDLIAAGHPLLRFDLLHYDAALPRHWAKKKGTLDFYESFVRTRKAGRALTLAAAAKLAAERAADHQKESSLDWSQRKVPWPELSDYDCYACHQVLSMDQYLLPTSQPGPELQVSSGLPIWNAWHSVGEKKLSEKALRALSPNQIDPAALAQGGQKLANDYLEEARQRATTTDVDAAAFLQAARAMLSQPPERQPPKERPPRSWNEAAIVYLDVEAALRQLSGSGGDESDRYRKMHDALLGNVQPLLQFDQGFHSPSNFDHDAAAAFTKKLLEITE